MGAVRALQAPRDASLGLSEGPPCPCSHTATNAMQKELRRPEPAKLVCVFPSSLCRLAQHCSSLAKTRDSRGSRLRSRRHSRLFLTRRPGDFTP
jgi:hypothetical protein